MTCDEALDLVEAIAAGDLDPGGDAREHFEGCPRCAAELASARRIEALLAARETPAAPVRFTHHVLARIRRDKWRSEQAVDRLFNVAIAVGVILMAGGVVALMNVNGVLAAAGAGWRIFTAATSGSVRIAAPSIGTYAAAICLFASALAMWWWAERRMGI